MASADTLKSAEPEALQPYKVPGVPDSLYYLPTFLPPSSQSTLQTSLSTVPKGKWTHLSRRRLLALPLPLTGLKKDTLLGGTSLPRWLLKEIGPKFEELGVFKGSPHGETNHCLVNEYEKGQGIMMHEDGPGYFPCVATVSIGGHMVLNLYDKETRELRWRILQEPGSLLVTRGGLYTDFLHGIEEMDEDVDLDKEHITNWEGLSGEFRRGVEEAGGRLERRTRVSFTFRDVLKVKNIGGLSKK